jgi:IPT/TIG domain
LSVSVTSAVAGTALETRTQYVRTDGVTEYYTWLNTHWTVYHAATSRFFETDPISNRVFVLDAQSQKQLATIVVPGAFGIDDTPDHSTLYVGTTIGDVYAIDPVQMTVKHRYIASQIGPYGYGAFSALVLADGRVALLGEQGGIPSVDGSTSIAIWNPADNSITIYGRLNATAGGAAPTQPLCPMGNIGGFARTGDRVGVLLGSVDSDGTLCELFPSTGKFLTTALGGFGAENLFSSPDGHYVVVRGGTSDQVLFYDAHTLTELFAINLPQGSTSSASSFTFSADSRTLYFMTDAVVYAYDIASKKQIGWLPNIQVLYTSGGLAVGPCCSPNYGAVDANGVLGGPIEEGFGFLDTTQLRTGAVGTTFSNAYLNPATGSASGGTSVQVSEPATANSESSVFFGKAPATSLSASGGSLSFTSPASDPGPVNVFVFTSDGGMQLIADGFSYGPSILQVTPDSSTAEGGGVGVIYGYGFAPAGATQVPPDLSVQVGGTPVAILGINSNAYGISSPPYLLQSILYTIPRGSAGSTADVSVTTGSGTTKENGALRYLPSLKQFSLSNASLVQGVYDPVRDVYYFTDANKIQVFSLSQGAWLTPISISPPSGTKQRLWGISLSPDATKLAIADAGAGVVYLLNPSDTTSVRIIPVAPSNPSGVVVLPAGVAITDSGLAYLTVDVQGGTGYHNFYKLDTNTGVLSDLGIDGPGLGSSDLNLRTSISFDGTRAYFNDDGYIFSVDTATGISLSASAGQGCCYGDYDLTLAPNQTQFQASSYLFDSDLNGVAAFADNDREILDVSYVYGTKFSSDGSLLFQPSAQGMDIYDGRVGTLRSRIAFPVPLSTNYDALVSDSKDDILIAITGATGTGIAIVDLSSVPEPSPLAYAAKVLLPSRDIRPQSSARPKAGQVVFANAAGRAKRPRVIRHVTNTDLLRVR